MLKHLRTNTIYQECMCGARPGEAYQLEKDLFIKPSLQPKHTLLKLPHAKK